MRTFSEKSKTAPQNTSTRPTMPSWGHFGSGHEGNSILRLQRTIGNQAMQRLLTRHAEDVKEDGNLPMHCELPLNSAARSSAGSEAASPTGTLFTVGEGTETAASASQLLDGTSATTTTADGPSCSEGGVTGSFTSIPNNVTLATSLSGSKLGTPFVMEAEFSSVSTTGNPAGGEYRQYVRGEFTRNGSTVTHPLCGNNLSPTVFHEDCANVGGTIYKYGYRSIRFGNSYFDNPDQATGSTFHGRDYPGITGSSGDRLTINLDFRGELVDICRNDRVLQTADWSVAGSATVP